MTAKDRQYAPREREAVFPVDDRKDEQLIAEAEMRARTAGFLPIDPAPTIITHQLRGRSVRIVSLLCRPNREKPPEHPYAEKGCLPKVTFVTAKRNRHAGAL